MKIGLNAWTVGGWGLNLPSGMEGVFKVAAELGYDGVEVVYDDSNYSPDRLSKKDRDHLVEVAQELGLSIPSVATGVFWKYDLASTSESERSIALQLLRKGLELAADLGAKTLLVVPTVARSRTSFKATYSLALSAIVEASRWAEDLNMKIGLENVWNRFLYDPLSFRRFIEETGSESVGFYFDVGNALELAPYEHWVEVLGDRFVMVHAKDYDFQSRGPRGFRLVGEGSVDWPGFISGLRSAGYDGFLNVETPPEFMVRDVAPVFPQDGVEAARISLKNLRRFIA